MLTVKVTGEKALEQMLARLGNQLTREHAEEDLMEAVRPMVTAASANVAVGPEPLHLRDHVGSSPDPDYAKSQGWLASVAIGATRAARVGEIFYGRFLEFGTVKMSVRPWLRPAYDSTRAAVVSRLASLIRRRVIAAGK